MKIDDNTGTGAGLKIDSKNRARVKAQTESDAILATREGDAYNIHSGVITFSAAGTLLYIKNNEERDLIVDNLVIAAGVGLLNDNIEVYTWKNVDAGDLVTDATTVAFKSNRNYGSAKELSADLYAGKSGGTVSGGEQVGTFFMTESSRLVAQINKVIPRGSTLAVSIDPDLAAGTCKIYCVATCYIQDSSESN